MVRRIVCGLGFTAAAVVLGASASAASVGASTVAVPQSVGIMPAVEVPHGSDPSPVPTLLETGGVVLLAAGAIVMARSWVSPVQPV